MIKLQAYSLLLDLASSKISSDGEGGLNSRLSVNLLHPFHLFWLWNGRFANFLETSEGSGFTLATVASS